VPCRNLLCRRHRLGRDFEHVSSIHQATSEWPRISGLPS
jgi:hypothetical protein